ncbi:TPA: VOC family protein [Legionella anisa]
MTIKHLQHYLIRAKKIEVSKKFYTEVLGLNVGYRPPFKFPGYWLYANNLPFVHLIEAGNKSLEQKTYLDNEMLEVQNPSGAIDHLAFAADHLEKVLSHFRHLNVIYQHRIVPEEEGANQLFIVDPDGIRIELNFSHNP